MADTLTLDVAPRSAKGKANKALRRSGAVPVHVFGPGIDPQALQVEEKELRHVIHQAGASGLIKLAVDGQQHNVMVRGVQRHPVTGRLVHVDLFRVRMDVKTKVRLPLLFVGESPAVKVLDGVLLHAVEAVNVEALPGDLPHHLEVDVSVLTELDQALHVSDIAVPAAVTVLDDPEELVAKVQPPRKVEEEVAPAEEAAPETAAPEAEAAPAAEAEAPAEPAAEATSE
ncbi:MAG TPA: 50S ribosomal protein L25 [Chloroflexota bacterium]|nr:50S ribosomal protein L25 [Chloroflexota bacterium]